jgi:Carboxypeptidase regulatory-like domain
MRRFLPTSIVILAFAAAVPPAHSQARAQTYRIAGTAVSSIDNHPLQRATVQLLDDTGVKIDQSTTTDELGHFAFTGVPAGNHELQGFAPGYLPTAYDEHEGFNTGIITGAGVDTESLVLKLRPEGTIAGAIRDESAEPVQGATVQLFRRSHNYGDSRVVAAANTQTDDLGRFELRHLLPGTYYLAVTATPWYAVHPDAVAESADARSAKSAYGRGPTSSLQLRPSPLADSIDPTLNVAYPATFYPGTTDPGSTSAIVIRGGDTVDLSFQLTPQPAFSVFLPHGTAGRGQPQPFPQLGATFLGQSLPTMGEVRQTPTQTVISGLAPGDYFVTDGGDGFHAAPGTAPIHITDHSITAAIDPASDDAHVHMQLKLADGGSVPANLFAGLIRRHSQSQNFVSSVINDKEQADLDVSPGDYYLSVESPQRRYFIRQIVADSDSHSDAQTLPTNDLHLASGDKRALTVTFSAGGHTLKGVTRKDGKPLPGAFLLLIPTSELHEIRIAFRQQSDLDGTFEIPGLDAGAYTLVAIDGGWDLDWQQDAVLSRYLRAAIPIQIPDSGEHTHELRDPVVVQNK